MFWQFDDGKIVVSTGSFHYWLESPALKRRLELAIRESLLNDLLVDGFELGVGFAELSSWAKKSSNLRKKLPGKFSFLSSEIAERILNLQHNTLHLPPLKLLSGAKIKPLLTDLRKVYEQTGISEFTVHPDEVSDSVWRRLLEAADENLVFSVENMDKDKKNFSSLAEMEVLLAQHKNLKLTFDLCHWTGMGRSAASPELQAFLLQHLDRISKIHLSTPHSANEEYVHAREIETSHYLFAGSGNVISDVFLRALPKGIPWVLEGVVPVHGYRLLKAEIELMRELSFSAANFKKVVGT